MIPPSAGVASATAGCAMSSAGRVGSSTGCVASAATGALDSSAIVSAVLTVARSGVDA